MSMWKNTIKIGLLFIFLFTVAVTPIGIMQIQNNELINQIHTNKLPQQEQSKSDSLDIIEKIGIIINEQNKQNGSIRTITRQEQVNIDSQSNIAKNAVQQLVLLQEKNVIPSLEFTQDYEIDNVSKITFLDFDNPQNVVKTIEMTLVFPNFYVGIWIDIETSVIYQFGVFSKELLQFKDKSDSKDCILAYMDYLGIPQEKISLKNSEDGGYCFYDDGTIRFSYEYIIDKEYIVFSLRY